MRITRLKTNSGSVMATTLIITGALAIILGSYISLLMSRTRIAARSTAWNTALPILEAGIEEALTHLHNDTTNWPASNGWSAVLSGTNILYQKRRNFTNDNAYCIVTISNATTRMPVIYSQGYVQSPLGTNYIMRSVQMVATNPATFGNAVSAKGTIKLSGSAYVDSFNSANPLYNTGGMYDPSLREANGGVVTDSSAVPAIQTSSAHIYGKVDTGPTGTVTGNVGGFGSSGVDSTWESHDMNVTYPDQVAPAGSSGWIAPSAGTVNGTNYQYNLTTGNFKLSVLTISQSGPGNPVVVSGNAVLYVTGNITVSGSGFIYMMPGASLTLIEGGSTAVISGGGIVNGTGYAKNFSYIGLPSNTSLTYSGSASFIGTVNAPEANFTISGSAAMVGAAIVNTFDDTGGAAIHYDEGIGGNGLLTMISYTEY